jgi:hypothetical protein
MSNPVLHAFFLGRAFAEVLTEKIEDNVTNALSELSKFDAEQRENLDWVLLVAEMLHCHHLHRKDFLL